LRETASPVKDPRLPEVSLLVKDLADTLAHWRTSSGYGRGIAAPQLGVSLRWSSCNCPVPKPGHW